MTRPTLRDYYFIKEVVVASDCEFDAGYSVRCINCGVSVGDEYQDEAVRLWNGETKSEAEEDHDD